MVNIDNDGPSDEEVSATSGALPSFSTKKHSPSLSRSKKLHGGKKRIPSSHEGKIIEIARPPTAAPPSSSASSSNYESFPSHRRSRSSYSRDDSSARSPSNNNDVQVVEKRQSSPSTKSKQQAMISRARQVLVHYHPQMGDDGYESTLLNDPVNTATNTKSHYGSSRGRSSPPTTMARPSSSMSNPVSSRPQWSGMHSRSIDDVREKEVMSNGKNDNVDDTASARQLRRRMYRMALERNVTLEETRRKVLAVDPSNDDKMIRQQQQSLATKESIPKSSPPQRTNVTPANNRRNVAAVSSPSESIASTSRQRNTHHPPPPPPPTTTPSYRAIVTNLIRNNEPEKLTQIDRVMNKYTGREEELITKLDLRYRKKKKKEGGSNAANSSESIVRRGESMIMSQEGHTTGSYGGQTRISQESVGESEGLGTASTATTATGNNMTPQGSPRKDRSAIQVMQSWDRNHNEVEDSNDGKHTEVENNVSSAAAINKQVPEVTVSTAMDMEEEQMDSELAISARTNSTRTEVHSNVTEKDVMDDEGRLPKVPESQTIHVDTPPRPTALTSTNRMTDDVDQQTSNQGSPAFNDDISLITMETKGTFNRNNRVIEGGEGVYSYAEMMRRPPASIIVDGATGNSSPASNPNSDLDYHLKSAEKKPLQQQFVPPKIQRLLPEYEKVSDEDKNKAAAVKSEAATKLDSVEARILARRRLREVSAALISERDESEPPSGRTNIKQPLEENSTMAFDEEESFVGRSKRVEQASSAIDNSFSLIESEADQLETTDTTLIRDNTAEKVNSECEAIRSNATDGLLIETKLASNHTSDSRLVDDNMPLDEALNDSMQVDPAKEDIDREPLDETNETDNTYTTCIQSPKAETKSLHAVPSPMETPEDEIRETEATESRGEEAVVAAASRDAEMQLKAMEDEIARLIAEKESRFAAEKAVALKKAEVALEEERKARLEAEEARLKAEEELERLKAVAGDRTSVTELNEPNSRGTDDTEKSQQLSENDETTRSLVHVEGPMLYTNEALKPVDAMDTKTEQELLSMIADMEDRSIPTAKAHQENDLSESKPPEATVEDDDLFDIVEQMRSVWAMDEDEEVDDTQHKKYASSEEESYYENRACDVDDENDSDHSDEQSYLPGSLHSSPDRSATIMPPQDSFPPLTAMPQEPLLEPLVRDDVPSSNDHDFPSMHMPHRQTSASQILDTTESQPLHETEQAAQPEDDTLPNKQSDLYDGHVEREGEGEANIHHVAKVSFDGNPAKGQLSFTTGEEVLAHSNQRGEWWLGRCGGRTGWFPASAVVPASEFLKNLVPALGEYQTEQPDNADVDLQFSKLTEEELHETYDLLRSPSGEDESPRAATKPDPSEDVEFEDQSSEPFVNSQSHVISAYDSMLDEYDSMLAPASATKQVNTKDDTSRNVSAGLNNDSSPGKKKPKRLWRSANDPTTGLTYYYNVKTRETTWEKPPDFVEKKSPAAAETAKSGDGEVGVREAVAKEARKGSKRFLGLFSKKKSAGERSRSTTPINISFQNNGPSSPSSNNVNQVASTTNSTKADTEMESTNQLVSSLNNAWEVDDDSSVSSEGTAGSIFSAKQMKKALVKVGSKIVGKISPTNAAPYDHMNDSFSQAGISQETSKKESDNVKKQPKGSNEIERSNEQKSLYDDDALGSKIIDSPWRSAIDNHTGRTYYFNKNTHEVVWEKPKKFS